MRGSAVTPLLVAGLVFLGVAALVDGLSDRAGDESTQAPRDGVDPAAVPLDASGELDALRRELEEAGVTGTLLYSDSKCAIHALELPALEEVRGPRERACRFTVSPEGSLGFGDEVAGPGGFDAARCVDPRPVKWMIGTGVERGPFLRVRGCAPSFHPDGRLTVVRDGMLTAGDPCARACSRVLPSRADAARALERFSWIPRGRVVIRTAAWLDAARVAAAVRVAEVGDFVAVFRGRRLLGEPQRVGVVSDLRASPLGRYVAARTPSGIVIVDRSGTWRLVAGAAASVAWSPDERWTAIARSRAIELADGIDGRTVRAVRLPIRATDVFWR
ncbi:MAG TPA: hypothetical protein VHF67_07260 [Gaiellaceae bacterium]|nr:hypothetical protein [Gaiellaceae bacterium]